MAAKTISELANWDGRLIQQRPSSKWRRSSSNFARDPPPESQPADNFHPANKSSDQKRVQRSAFRSNPERGSLSNSLANARLPSRVDTTSTPSHGIHHPRQASIAHTAPNPALHLFPSITSSKASHITPHSSVHASRVHRLRTSSSRRPIAPSQSASTMDSEIIDLTLDDTEDELSVGDMLVPSSEKSNGHHTDPGPSGLTLSSGRSSSISPEQSLFTPPPSRRRARLRFDYLAVPPFPKGLTKADYKAMSDHSVVLPLDPAITSTLRDPSLAELPVTKVCTPKGKERELDIVSSRKRFKQRLVANGVDAIANVFIDAFYEHAIIPLYDDDIYPSLTAFDLLTNTRFQFAHAWREHASRLQGAELDCMSKFKLLGKSCIWVLSENRPSPRLSGTAGYVSSEQLRPWELVPPDGSAQDQNTDHIPNVQAHATESQTAVEVHNDHLLPSDDVPPGPSAPVDPALSNSTTSQGSTVLDMERDMHQYFNGLGDSPPKHAPHPTLAPTQTFRPHLFQSSQHAQINSLDFGFPPLELDPGLADTSGHECFLGLPPSPPRATVRSPTTPSSIPDHPIDHTDNPPPSPSNVFDTSPTDVWSSFSQGEGLQPESDSPPSNPVGPTSLGTIDPSLLGVEQSQQRSPVPKDLTPKRRSKLPEPVIYVRRPVDSSSLPLRSGKRSVQIKYRDSGDCPASSAEVPSKPRGNSEKTSDAEDSKRLKRHSLPSRKLREYRAASESDSNYSPDTSTSKIKLKLKLKRPSLKNGVERRDVGAEAAPTMSSCHQCRRATERPKMSCSNVVQGRVCGKRFCNRCILYRYPEVTFDEHSAGFLCPVCTNTCNCSYCSRSRGEEFVSMRLGGLATSFFKTKVTLVRDIGKPLPRTQSPPSMDADARGGVSATTTPTPEPSALPMQSQFWAHVYGIEGERMGSAFMAREHMGRLQTQGPSPLPPLSKKTTEVERKKKPEGPRVFIGRPLESWKVRAVRDLEPSVDVESRGRGDGTEGETGAGIVLAGRRRRCYIGNRTPLYEPYGRMASPMGSQSRCTTSVLDSDGSLTPLSELEVEADDWPQPDVGEYCSWTPPPPGSGPFSAVSTWPDASGVQARGSCSGSGAEMDMDCVDEPASPSTALSEEDLARAINAALAALSVESRS